MDEVECRLEIHVDYGIPIVVAHAHEKSILGDACVVDHDVNPAELGENLQKIVKRLLANDELVKLLYYEQDDPMGQPALSAEAKEQEVFEKLIKTVPRVGTKDTAKSVIVVYVQKAGKLSGNKEFRNVRILVDVIVPLTQWYIRDTNFRPFAILGQI